MLAAPTKERLESLDFIRGCALFGILIMNIVGMGLGPAYDNPTAMGGDTGVNIEAIAPGAFDWLVFDEPNGVLGFSTPSVPEPTMVAPVLLLMSVGLSRYNRRQRCR